MLTTFFYSLLALDQTVAQLTAQYGPWIYALLFAVIFVETGVVVMPFLPGDSLLFVVGALCGLGLMQLGLALPLLVVAAVLGDQMNFSIGRYFGPKVWQWEHSRFFNKRAFHQAHEFYEKYGGITIMLARFLPFIRTFVPFVAGVAEMSRRKFTMYNVAGALVWVLSLVTAGYLFGNMPWAKANMSIIIWAMIIVPGVIALFGAWKAKRKSLKPAA
jgi:membrane-associated protein